MPTPADLAKFYARKQRTESNRNLDNPYVTGAFTDNSVAATIDPTQLKQLVEFRNALGDAQQVFGDRFNEPQLQDAYTRVRQLAIGEASELGDDTRIFPVMFAADESEQSDDAPERVRGTNSRSGASISVGCYMIALTLSEDGPTMIAEPIEYEYGNATYVSRDPRCGKADALASADGMTKSRFKVETGALSVIHIGGMDALQKRVDELASLTPEAFADERARRERRNRVRRTIPHRAEQAHAVGV